MLQPIDRQSAHALLRHTMCRLAQGYQNIIHRLDRIEAILRSHLLGLAKASWLASAACSAAPLAHTPGHRQCTRRLHAGRPFRALSARNRAGRQVSAQQKRPLCDVGDVDCGNT